MTTNKNPKIKETQIPERINPWEVGSVLKVRQDFCAYPYLGKGALYDLFNINRVTATGEIVPSLKDRSNKFFKLGEHVFLLDSFSFEKPEMPPSPYKVNVWVFLYEGFKYSLMVPSYMTQQEFFKHT